MKPDPQVDCALPVLFSARIRPHPRPRAPRPPAGPRARWVRALALLVLLAGAAVPAARAGDGADGVLLAEDGSPRAAIVHHGHADIAAALAEVLQRSTGAALPVVAAGAERPDGVPDTVELRLVDAVPGASDRPTARQAYRLTAADGRLTLEASTELGLKYAVYGFLEDHVGCRFYAPDVEVAPTRATLRIAPFVETQEPAIQIRSFIYYPHAFQSGWVHRNRGGGLPADTVCSSHTFYNYLPPQEHFEAHPEWYPLVGGKRTKTWSMAFCYTNPEMASAFAEAVKETMARRAAATAEAIRKKPSLDPANPLQIGQGDGFTACECPVCRALVAKEGSEAAPLLLMMNRVLEETAKTYPEQGICTFAYFGTLPVPKTLKPHPLLWINVVSSSVAPGPSGDQLGPIRENIHNRDYREALQNWPTVAPGRVTTWDWSHWGPYYWPNLYNSVDNIRFWRECGITGGQFQVGWGSGNFAWLRNWLYLKILWNPDADADALIRDFLQGYYGPRAAPLVWDFLQAAERNGRESGYAACLARWNYWPATLREKLYPAPVAERLDQILALAQAAAETEDDPAYAHRVVEARASAVDSILLDGMGALAHTPALEDGAVWFVPGGRPDAVARLRRGVAAIRRRRAFPGASHEREIASLVGKRGGPVLAVASDALRLEVVPNLQARAVSLVHKPTGREILCFTGAPGCRETVRRFVWCLREAKVDGPAIRTTAKLEVGQWKWARDQLVDLDYVLADDGTALRVERRYSFDGHGQQVNGRFGLAWNLYLPDPAAARVVVRGGGVEQAFAPPTDPAGGVTGALQEDESRARRDNMDPLLDAVEAVPDAEERTLDFAAGDGDAEVKLIRGDGLTVTLTTPVADTAGVRIRAVAAERRIEITFPGRPIAIPSGRGKEPFRAALPPVTLRVEAAEPDAAPRTRVNPVDGAELVWIPAGSFLRGSNAPDSQRGERPERRIHLDGYWIYRTPVTAAMYRTFCEATGRKMPAEFWGKALEGETPMLGLNWRQAAAYAEWAGVRLPTEAQWERAARGDDGRVYPWGNAWDPDRCWCQANTLHADEPWPHPVRTRPAGTSPFGVEDMAGNCWEYVRDWHAPDAHRRSPAINPAGPGSGTHKVLKGGSWQWDRTYLRSAYREANPPHIDNWLWVGFRCVLDQAAPTRDQETNTEAD